MSGNVHDPLRYVVVEIPDIDYDDAVPPYQQVARWVREQIESGQIQPGKPIPSETDLVQYFGIARGTARRAVRDLRESGLVVTVAGRGSYARRP